jgi:hypothetical protein
MLVVGDTKVHSQLGQSGVNHEFPNRCGILAQQLISHLPFTGDGDVTHSTAVKSGSGMGTSLRLPRFETLKHHDDQVTAFHVLGLAPHVTHSSYRQGSIGGFINLKDPHAHSIEAISPGVSVFCQRLVASLFVDRLWRQ